MSLSGEISLAKRTRGFGGFNIDGVHLDPRNYIRVGHGFNLDYETPPLLSCLPSSRHLKHQQILVKFMEQIYEKLEIPEETKAAYFTQWKDLHTRHLQKSPIPGIMHYGLTFQNRGEWGDNEPLPLIRYTFP